VDSDEQLMIRVQAGDEDAVTELVTRWRARLYGFLMRRAPDVADDLFQETWIRVVRAAERFDPSRRFSTWLFQIANNLCRDRARRRAVEESYRQTVREEIQHDAGRLDPPPLDLRLDMHRRVHALPERLREVLLLRYYHRLSEAEIANAVGIPRGTVKSRLHHAVRALRQQMAEADA
jgi:RNA polymerase sigma-70 factor (ECF subfamily)